MRVLKMAWKMVKLRDWCLEEMMGKRTLKAEKMGVNWAGWMGLTKVHLMELMKAHLMEPRLGYQWERL